MADELSARSERSNRGGLWGRRSPGSGGSYSAARRDAASQTRPDHRGRLEGRGTDAELVRHQALAFIANDEASEPSPMSPDGTDVLLELSDDSHGFRRDFTVRFLLPYG